MAGRGSSVEGCWCWWLHRVASGAVKRRTATGIRVGWIRTGGGGLRLLLPHSVCVRARACGASTIGKGVVRGQSDARARVRATAEQAALRRLMHG
eukprot:5072225-Pleurochrysis_carterae.AAC.9